jgi:hypothetical protein
MNVEAKQTVCDGKFDILRKSSKCQTKCQADFDVTLAVKRVAYFQTVSASRLYYSTLDWTYKSPIILIT